MRAEYWVSISLIVLGIILFIYLVSRKKYRDPSAAINYDKLKRGTSKPISHYTEMRDKLSLREIKKVEDGSYPTIAPLIGGFVVILVGMSLLPTITEQLNISTASANVTGVTTRFLNFVPTFFVITLIVMVIGIAFNSLNRSGLI